VNFPLLRISRARLLADQASARLHRAYLMKEGLRHVFAVKGEEGKDALERGPGTLQGLRLGNAVSAQEPRLPGADTLRTAPVPQPAELVLSQ